MFFWFSCPLSEFWSWFRLCTWWEFKTRLRTKCFMHRNNMEYTRLWGIFWVFFLPVMSHMQANHMDTNTHMLPPDSFFWGTKDVNSSTSKLMWQMSHSLNPDLDLRKFSLVVLATDYNLYFYHTHPHWDQEGPESASLAFSKQQNVVSFHLVFFSDHHSLRCSS